MIEREMHGDLYINGVKVRENEVHEPTIKTEFIPYGQGYRLEACCSVCGRYVGGAFYANATEKQAIAMFKYNALGENSYNYCPNCGARLKEVE